MKINPKIFILWLIVSSNVCYGQISINRFLRKAYNSNSISELEAIFIDWNTKIKSNFSEIEKYDTIRNLYEIFYEFYTPHKLSRIGKCQWKDTIYLRSNFFCNSELN